MSYITPIGVAGICILVVLVCIGCLAMWLFIAWLMKKMATEREQRDRLRKKVKPNVYETKVFNPRTGRSSSVIITSESNSRHGTRASRYSVMSTNTYASIDELSLLQRTQSLDREYKRRIYSVSQTTYPSTQQSREYLDEDGRLGTSGDIMHSQPLVKQANANFDIEAGNIPSQQRHGYHLRRQKRKSKKRSKKPIRTERYWSDSSEDERRGRRISDEERAGGSSCENLLDPPVEDIISVPDVPYDDKDIHQHLQNQQDINSDLVENPIEPPNHETNHILDMPNNVTQTHQHLQSQAVDIGEVEWTGDIECQIEMQDCNYYEEDNQDDSIVPDINVQEHSDIEKLSATESVTAPEQGPTCKQTPVDVETSDLQQGVCSSEGLNSLNQCNEEELEASHLASMGSLNHASDFNDGLTSLNQCNEEEGKNFHRASIGSLSHVSDLNGDGFATAEIDTENGLNNISDFNGSLDRRHVAISEKFDKMIPSTYQRFSSEDDLSAEEEVREDPVVELSRTIVSFTNKYPWDISQDVETPSTTVACDLEEVQVNTERLQQRTPDNESRKDYTSPCSKSNMVKNILYESVDNNRSMADNPIPYSKRHMVDNILYESAAGEHVNSGDRLTGRQYPDENIYEPVNPLSDANSVADRFSVTDHWEEDSVFAGLQGNNSRIVTEDEAAHLEYDYEDLHSYRRDRTGAGNDGCTQGLLYKSEVVGLPTSAKTGSSSTSSMNSDQEKFFTDVKETLQMIKDDSYCPAMAHTEIEMQLQPTDGNMHGLESRTLSVSEVSEGREAPLESQPDEYKHYTSIMSESDSVIDL